MVPNESGSEEQDDEDEEGEELAGSLLVMLLYGRYISNIKGLPTIWQSEVEEGVLEQMPFPKP